MFWILDLYNEYLWAKMQYSYLINDMNTLEIEKSKKSFNMVVLKLNAPLTQCLVLFSRFKISQFRPDVDSFAKKPKVKPS